MAQQDLNLNVHKINEPTLPSAKASPEEFQDQVYYTDFYIGGLGYPTRNLDWLTHLSKTTAQQSSNDPLIPYLLISVGATLALNMIMLSLYVFSPAQSQPSTNQIKTEKIIRDIAPPTPKATVTRTAKAAQRIHLDSVITQELRDQVQKISQAADEILLDSKKYR